MRIPSSKDHDSAYSAFKDIGTQICWWRCSARERRRAAVEVLMAKPRVFTCMLALYIHVHTNVMFVAGMSSPASLSLKSLWLSLLQEVICPWMSELSFITCHFLSAAVPGRLLLWGDGCDPSLFG